MLVEVAVCLLGAQTGTGQGSRHLGGQLSLNALFSVWRPSICVAVPGFLGF